jgi:Copper type II ascorbate-dependent monooxygenase, C-terminal domain
MRRQLTWACVLAVVALLAACTSTHESAGNSRSATASPSTSSPSASPPPPRPVPVAPLRHGERWINLTMPGGVYHPQAEAGGTDDYRCILLDPHLRTTSFLSGVALVPGNPKLVHHAILYRVDPGQLGAAKLKDAADPRLGWSCFGDPGLPGGSDVVSTLNSAPWVAAWATTGGEQRFAAGTGQRLAPGTRLILQMHYNLLNGTGLDNTEVRLRVAPAGAHLQPLHTLLLPGPVELPCPTDQSGPLCDRTASILDVMRRFGQQAGGTVAGLQLLCGGSVQHPRAGPTQSCTRPVTQTIHIRAVAGHMHLLGRSIRIDLLRQDGTRQSLLNVKVWDFDNQRATVLAQKVTVHAGDRLKVTCTHDARLREELPELKKLPPRYVVWGEGSSDEMCLGIVSYTESG